MPPIVVEGTHNTHWPPIASETAAAPSLTARNSSFNDGPSSATRSAEMTSFMGRVGAIGADRWFAAGNVAVAVIAVLAGVRAPPVFSPSIALPALAVAALLAASAAGLAARARWASLVTRIAGVALL